MKKMPKGVVELLKNMDKQARFYAFYRGMAHTFKKEYPLESMRRR